MGGGAQVPSWIRAAMPSFNPHDSVTLPSSSRYSAQDSKSIDRSLAGAPNQKAPPLLVPVTRVLMDTLSPSAMRSTTSRPSVRACSRKRCRAST